MPTNQFTPEVTDALKWYVYRLIDPRNGETFYVGKGKANRVFAHAAGVPDDDAVVSHPVLQRIKEVQMAGQRCPTSSTATASQRNGQPTKWKQP